MFTTQTCGASTWRIRRKAMTKPQLLLLLLVFWTVTSAGDVTSSKSSTSLVGDNDFRIVSYSGMLNPVLEYA